LHEVILAHTEPEFAASAPAPARLAVAHYDGGVARPRKIPLERVRHRALTRFEYARRAGRGSPESRVVAIVGMHRSGTTALTGTLQQAGLYLGDVSRKGGANPHRGDRESDEIMKLHDEILVYSGGSWRDPPTKVVWSDEHRRHRDRIIDSFAEAELWGFKDPRSVLLLDFWRERLGDSLELVGIFREPRAVVASLLAIYGGTPEEWFALWTHLNSELLREHAARPFPLVEFVPDAGRFHEQLVPVLRALGLRERRRPRFFDSGLPTVAHSQRSEPQPGAASSLYEELTSAAKAFQSLASR
jgi:hypothetical protein